MNLLWRLLWAGLSAAVALTAISVFGQQSSPPSTQEQQQKQEQPSKPEQGQPQQGQPQASKMDVSRLFATTCGWCHEGGGRKQGRGPKLAGTDKSDQFMINRIKQGKAPGMPAFGRAFNDEQIQAIVAYIRSLPE
jgi:mono/diheme cytochrome c family protein